MRPSLDPETHVAKLLCSFAGHNPEAMIAGGYDLEGSYYPSFSQPHLFDHQHGMTHQVFAWRKYVCAARKMIEELRRSGQTIYQSKPHYFHGDHEPVRNFWMGWWAKPQEFTLFWPWQRTGYYDGGETYRAAIQARSEKEAVALVFDSYDVVPELFRVEFMEMKPNDWCPFGSTFKRSDWMTWDKLPDDQR